MSVNTLVEKWQPVLEHPDLPKIENTHKREVVAQLLENQQLDAMQNVSGGYQTPTLLGETPTNAFGNAGGDGTATGQVDVFDPVLISLIRRAAPQMIAYDICGVQPMTGPTGLIFAMHSQYADDGTSKQSAANEANRTEAFFNEADTNISASSNNAIGGVTSQGGLFGDGTGSSETDPTTRTSTYAVRQAMDTADAEALGTDGNAFSEMAFSIEKVSVVARSRALKAEYTMELAQDLKAVHGLDAEQELSNILSTEILSEINREVVRSVNIVAVDGAKENVATQGTFDLDVDANGRWSVERFKGLMFQLEREANAIAKATRRGKGNLIICSSDVASALQMAGVLDYTPALTNSLSVDDTGNTFVGVLNGRFKVYIDPYFASSTGLQYVNVGYKGSNPFDAGIFYCPYVPLQMVRAIGEDTFQPKIGFKTRYGMVANPFSKGANGRLTTPTDNQLEKRANEYYRLFAVKNLM
jgi:hypothetical protein